MSDEQQIEEIKEIEEATATDDYEFADGFDVFAANQEETVVEEEVVEEEDPEEEVVDASKVKEEEEKPGEEKPEEKTADQIIADLNQTLAEERAKKQAAREELRRLQTPVKPKQEEPKKFDWEDPDSTIEEIKTGFQSEIQKVKLDLSESAAMSRHEDYTEKYKVFADMAQQNPAYITEMLKQVDPAEWAYQQAVKHESLSEIGDDPVAYKAQLKETLKAEILAELKGQDIETKIQKAAVKLPPSATKIKGKVVKDGEVTISDDPLGDFWGEDR